VFVKRVSCFHKSEVSFLTSQARGRAFESRHPLQFRLVPHVCIVMSASASPDSPLGFFIGVAGFAVLKGCLTEIAPCFARVSIL
jgi:hypothetical protein